MTPNENAARASAAAGEGEDPEQVVGVAFEGELVEPVPAGTANAGSLPLMGGRRSARGKRPLRRAGAIERSRASQTFFVKTMCFRLTACAVHVDELAIRIEVLRAAQRERVFPCVHPRDPMPPVSFSCSPG